MQRRQRCLCGASNCVGWLGKESAESSKTSPDDNIAPELRATTSAAAEDTTAPAPKKILLKLGGTPQSARGVKRQASTGGEGEEDIISKKRAGSTADFKGKGKAVDAKFATPEAATIDGVAEASVHPDLVHAAALAEGIPEEYLAPDLQATSEMPASSNLSSLLHHNGDEYVEEHYAETGEFPAGEAYPEAGAYQEGMSFSEANAEEYAPEASSHLELSRPKASNKGKGVRVIEKHRRKTKYGLIWKSDAELELERR